MSDFTLPTNIKQIGSIGDGLRIYVEDYVCTYLQAYAEAGGYKERLAFLVGRHMNIDGQPILFISGAIAGEYAEEHEGILRFSQRSITLAEQALEAHFVGMEIVGWMQSQPSYGVYLNQHYAAYHRRQFHEPHQVMFVMDPMERTNAFYEQNPEALSPAGMSEIRGYFIYYDKNTNMHEYMLAHKIEDYTAVSPTFIERTPLEFADDAYPLPEALPEGLPEARLETLTDALPEHIAASPGDPDFEAHRQAVRMERRGAAAEQRRATNLLGSLCAILFVVCFVMGVGLMRNQDRISRMELEMRQLSTAYRNLFTQMGGLTPVFAGQDDTNADDQVNAPPETTEPIQTNEPQSANGDTDRPPTVPINPLPGNNANDTALLPPVPPMYTIQPGDSLIAISRYFFGDENMVDSIMALNNIEDPDHIVAGRTLALPSR